MIVRRSHSSTLLRSLAVAAWLPAITTCTPPDLTAPPTTTGAESGAGAAGRPPFIEVATDVGLEFRHHNGMSGQYFYAEIMGSGVGLVDYDNDGDLDVYLVQGHSLDPSAEPSIERQSRSDDMQPLRDRLYRADLDAEQADVTGLRYTDVTDTSGLDASGYGMGIATGDVDNDGDVDLFITNFGPNELYLNQGDGTFAQTSSLPDSGDPRWSFSAAFFDYDLDGDLDLYVANYVDFTVSAHRPCRAMTGRTDYCGPTAYRPQPDRLMRNRGDGTFEDVSAEAGISARAANGMGVVTGDFNDDGLPDAYVANDAMANLMWINRGDGTFRDLALAMGSALNSRGEAEAGMGLAAGDYDGDGDEDLLVTHLALETNTLYRNLGNGMFDDASVLSGLGPPSWAFTGFGTGWLDYDNDGRLDLMTVDGAVMIIPELADRGDPHPFHMPNHLFHNQGDGSFREVGSLSGEAFGLSEVSRGLAIGDLDNDGDPDAVVSNNNGPARLLLNQAGQSRRWMGLRLLDTACRRDMTGSAVEIRRAGNVTMRRVRTGGSYLSASDPRVVIGLVDDGDRDDLVVHWPGGVSERFSAEIGRYTTLCQGSGEALAAPRAHED